MSRHPIPKRVHFGCLTGLVAGLVFMAPAPPCQAEAPPAPGQETQSLQVAESLLNQEPKPRPVMRHNEVVPAPSAVTPRPPRAKAAISAAKPASQVKRDKKKKPKLKAAAPEADKVSVKAKTKAKSAAQPALQSQKATGKAPVKSGKRKAKKDKSR